MFVTGVPVANTMLLPRPLPRRYSHFIRRSSHLAASLVCMPGTEPPDTARFLK